MKAQMIIASLAAVWGMTVAAVAQPDATEIVRKADKHLRGETSKSEMTMKIVRPSWSRTIELKTWSKGNDYGLILITAPPRDEGTVFLKRENEVWQWVPSISRTIKIPPSMMMQSWMGSDFTNNDLVQEASIVDDYAHTLLGDTAIRGYDSWVIEMEPKPEAPVVWDRVKAWIAKDTYIQLRAEYYGEDGELVNTLVMDEIEEMGGRMLPTRWTMVPADEENQKTIMTYESIAFDIDLPTSFFSLQNMKRVR